jgi:hypothetical protein
MERLRREVSAEKRKNMNVKLAAGESDEVPDELRCPISERCFAPPPVRTHSAEDRWGLACTMVSCGELALEVGTARYGRVPERSRR